MDNSLASSEEGRSESSSDDDSYDESEDDDDDLSSASSSEHSLPHRGHPSTAVRRRRTIRDNDDDEQSSDSYDRVSDESRKKREKDGHCIRRLKRRIVQNWTIRMYDDNALSGCATLALCTSFLLYLSLLFFPEAPLTADSYYERIQMTEDRRGRLRSRDQGQPESFGQSILDPFRHIMDPRIISAREKKSSGGVERLQPGCERPKWQEASFPSCNDIHAIELASVYENPVTHAPNGQVIGYLNKGLWRGVWSVLPSDVMKDSVVLKMMHSKHTVDERNLDRHRRDAIVMERLASNKHVVDIYGHCANSVLSEFIATTLEDIVNDHESPRLEYPTRRTPLGRLQLALQAAKGLLGLHGVPGGPIVHADLQSKQLLVLPDGTVKINDFNRCRFVAHRNNTGEACPFKVPTAPGKSRAPEEYAYYDLNEKLDIFSLGHVFYEILSGENPWTGWSSVEVKKTVQKGLKPLVAEEFRIPGSTDEALSNLTLRMYELDPIKRISASELVHEISLLLASASDTKANVSSAHQ